MNGPRDVELPGPEQINDTEDYIEARRYKQIYDARERVNEVELQAREATLQGHADGEQAALMYRAAVEQYIQELEAVSHNANREFAEYWHEQPLGEIRISPIVGRSLNEDTVSSAAEHTVKIGGETVTAAKVEPTSETIELSGLADILNLPEQLSADFEIKQESYVRARSAKTITVTEPIGFDTLKRAFRLADALRSEMGIELSFDGEEAAQADPI